jgi:hypothetical protein
MSMASCPLGAELQLRRQSHGPGPARILDLGPRDPLPGADQRVPGALADVGQVDGIDPVGHFPGAAQVLPLHARRGGARLLLAGLIQRPDHQPAPAAGTPRRLGQAGDSEPAHRSSRRGCVPHGPAEQPLGLIRRPVPGMLGDRPAVTPGQAAGQGAKVLPGLHPRLGPGETRPQ